MIGQGELLATLRGEDLIPGQLVRFYEAVCDAAMDIIPVYTRTPACCISATRAMIGVMDYFKIDARPLPVKVLIFNARWLELEKEWGRFPDTDKPDEMTHWLEQGAYSIGLGYGKPQWNQWPGHLVAVCRGGLPSGLPVMLDVTLPQANKPEKNIRAEPVFGPTVDGFLAGQVTSEFMMHGCKIVYVPQPSLQSFRDMTDWKNTAMQSRIIRDVIRRLKMEGFR